MLPADLVGEIRHAKIVITNYHAFKLREELQLASGTKALKFLFLFLLFSISSAFARIEETEEELVKRFGPVESRRKEQITEHRKHYPFGDVLSFKAGSWYVNAVLIDERCAQIQYVKQGGRFAPEDIKKLLESNRNGFVWTTDSSGRKWVRGDGIIAEDSPRFGFLVTAPIYEKRKKQALESAKKEAIKAPHF
jgi:hypothetical protein